MLLALFATLAIFFGTVAGLASPLVRRLPLDAPEKIVVGAALSLLGVFLAAWTIYVTTWPAALLWCLPVLGFSALAFQWRSLATALREPDARALVLGQGIVIAWCLGWLSLVATYSGGGWAADWFEHWERTRFFIERGSPDTIFIGHATLTARPPLANVIVGAFLALTRSDFATYQLVSTLLASLVFLPMALLARRWGGGRAIPLVAVAAMLNPLFVQNATFAWTKLPAVFFALAGLCFFVRAVRAARPALDAALCGGLLAAGLLTHYSVGPYVLLLAAGWLCATWARRREAAWWRATAGAAFAGGALLATWFAWAFQTYGASGTLLANTSVVAADPQLGGQLARIALNLRDTIVPHFLRTFDQSLIAQHGPWGAVRDAWFQLYQVNLPFAFGSVAWIVLLVAIAHAWRDAPRRTRAGWTAFVAGAAILGVAVHGARDTWGLAHICLQPLVLLGLAFLASAWPRLPAFWQRWLIVGAAVDFCFGLALHFAVQNLAFERWSGPAAFAQWQANASAPAVMNLAAKLEHKLTFVSDLVAHPPGLTGALLLGLLVIAVRQVRRADRLHQAP